MKKMFSFLIPAVLLLGVSGNQFPGSGPRSGGEVVNDLLDRSGSLHAFTDEEYLRPKPFQPVGTLVPIFDDADDGVIDFLIPVLDSIRNSVGRFADSTYAGADLRLTIGVMPTVTTDPPTGGAMSVAEVKSLNSRQKYYEIASHGTNGKELGRLGLDTSGDRVSFGGATSMQAAFLDTVLAYNQQWAIDNGIMPFRSHMYARWRAQLGMEDTWRKHGYFQCKSWSVNQGYDNNTASLIGNELTPDQRNYDPFYPSVFNVDGKPVYDGMHAIGEPFNSYDIGSRVSWDNTRDVPDSLEKYTDVISQLHAIGLMTFHGIETSVVDNLDMSTADMYSLVYFWAHRVSEGTLRFATLEQAASMLRGYLYGDILGSQNLTMLSQSAVTSSWTDEILVPIGLIPPFGHAGSGFTGFYYAGVDTFVAPAGTATQWKMLPADTVAVAESLKVDGGDTDSLSFGMADANGDVMVATMTDPTYSPMVTLVIRTTGCKPGTRYIDIEVQTLALTQPAPNGFGSGNTTINYKAGQFTYVWEDNLSRGPGAYACMAQIVAKRAQAPVLANFKWEAQIVRPQFELFTSDTTRGQAGQNAFWGQDTTIVDYQGENLNYWMNPTTLIMSRLLNKTTDWDLGASWGATGVTNQLLVVGNANDDHDDNWQPISGWSQPFNHYITVPINGQTDFVYCVLWIQATTTTPSAAADVAILHLSATPRE